MARGYKVTIRRTGRTQRTRHESLPAALDHLLTEMRVLAQTERRRTRRPLGREYEPVAQVAARGEISGPGGLRAGIDLRGDGSTEAFTGRLRRQVIEPEAREDAFGALRRVVGEG